MRNVGCLLLFALLFASEAFAASVDVGGLWGGMWHKTNPDGSQVECLDTGLNDSTIKSLAGLTFTVTGPSGFNPYTFSSADLYVDGSGIPELYHELPAPIPPGTYTFTLDDGAGHLSRVCDTQVTAPVLPLVDTATVQRQRNADGSYHFSWAPVNDTRTYTYRLVIAADDAAGTAIYYGPRSMNPAADVPPGTLQDGVTYRAQVQIHDSPSFELDTNRSYAAYVDFVPLASDYDQKKLGVDYASVYNRFESNGTTSTDISLGLSSLAGVTLATVTGPDHLVRPFDLIKDRDPSWPELYLNVTTPLAAGLYTFHFVANGVDQYAYTNLTAPVSYPAPDAATYRAEDQGGGTIRFSWAGVDHVGALYYRVYLKDPATEQYTVTARTNKTYVDLAAAGFSWLANPQWRVEVFDSSSINSQRNRALGPLVALAVKPYDAHNPILTANISNATNYNGQQVSDIWMSSWGPTVTTTGMRLDGPNGYSRDIFTAGGYTDFLEPVTPAPGLYSFTAVDSSGKSTVRYHYLPAAHHIDPVDFRTVNVNRESYGYLSLSWAPVASDLPLWYAVEFYYTADQNGDGQLDPVPLQVPYRFTGSSLWIPESDLPAVPFMFRIFAFDGSDGSSYNNYSRSVMVGYSGPGYNYAALTDDDGDGYVSNVDTDDANPSVNPFPYPQISAFSIPATSASLTVPITTIASNLSKGAGGCLTETNNSATCSWTSVKPVSYSFATPGTHTLYAFIRDASGNVSAPASAQTSITLLNAPLSLAFVGSGTGQVTGGMACTKGESCPPVSFGTGTQVTLNPLPGTDSLFTGWSGDCVVSGNSCIVAMNAAKSVSAGFDIMPAVWLTPGSAAANYFGLLTDAYQVAGAGATIKVKSGTFTESLLLNRGIGIKLKGGFNAGYQSNLGSRSILHGTLIVRSGSLVAEGLAIH